MKLSEKIVRLRKSRGMTQEEMAEHCVVTRQSISKWEADIALPETEKLLMLSEIFGVPLDTLLRDERTLDAVRENPQCGPNAIQMQKKAMYEGILIKESPEDDAKDNWFADFKAGGIGNYHLSRKGAHLSNRKRSGEGARLRGLP